MEMTKILFLGDLFYNYNKIEKDIKEIGDFIKSNNYKCILNLEGSLSKSPIKIKKRGPNLYHSEVTIEVLKQLNVIGVCLSNNHLMDYDVEGLTETLRVLDENNIKHCGAGNNLEEALKPMEFEFDNKKIKIYNYGWDVEETVYATNDKPGCSPKVDKYILKNEKKSGNADLVIKIFHWGFEYNIYPMPIDIKLAHNMIDNGTDLIIGHHPHVIQAKEEYKGKNIYYSLGNFYFSSRRENFLKKKFTGNIGDKCSYGLGVVYNIENEKIEREIFIYYNKDTKYSEIIDIRKNIDELFTDISNIDYYSKQYYKLIKKTKLNKNPILTGSKMSDKLKIKILYLKYFIKNILKFVISVSR